MEPTVLDISTRYPCASHFTAMGKATPKYILVSHHQAMRDMTRALFFLLFLFPFFLLSTKWVEEFRPSVKKKDKKNYIIVIQILMLCTNWEFAFAFAEL